MPMTTAATMMKMMVVWMEHALVEVMLFQTQTSNI